MGNFWRERGGEREDGGREEEEESGGRGESENPSKNKIGLNSRNKECRYKY